jgi:signal transduction histidine kinase
MDKDAEIARLKSELEAAQKQLSNMKDMAKVGELAATMAHEIRNPLAGISSLSEVLRMKIDDSGPIGEIIDTILEEVDRLNRIIKDLLRFAKPGKAVLGSLNLPDTIGNVLTFLDERLTEGRFEVTREFAECPNVMADTEQMRQVLLNVFINAMDAIKDPKHTRQDDGKLAIKVEEIPDEKVVAISLTDNGPGIPDEAIQDIFEPFFTTKAQGTGLGLAACRKIIELHGGTITVDSTVGEGTTFVIKMPIEK